MGRFLHQNSASDITTLSSSTELFYVLCKRGEQIHEKTICYCVVVHLLSCLNFLYCTVEMS